MSSSFYVCQRKDGAYVDMSADVKMGETMLSLNSPLKSIRSSPHVVHFPHGVWG